MKEIRIEAKTITDAVEKGLKELNLTREQAEVEIIQKEKRGILGFGSRKACVLVREKKWTGDSGHEETRQARRERREHEDEKKRDNSRSPRRQSQARRERSHTPDARERLHRQDSHEMPAAERKPTSIETFDLKTYDIKLQPTGDILDDSKNLLSQIMNLSGINCALGECKYDRDKKLIYISFSTPDIGLLLYDDARGLLSLQYLVSSIINRNRPEKMIVKLDTGNFWSRTQERIRSDVARAIEFVKRTGKPYRLRPMSSQFRKLVHDMIKEKYPGFETYSEGEDKWRKVVIKQGKISTENK